MDSIVPEPDYDDPKEVYAFFGLAFYWAQVFEHSVLNLAVVLHLNNVNVVTTQVFDKTFEDLDAKTLGELLKGARKLTAIEKDTDALLSDVLENRNDLAHHYFKRHSESLLSKAGKKEMIDELSTLVKRFKEADERVTALYSPLWAKYGVTEEYVESELEKSRLRAEERDHA